MAKSTNPFRYFDSSPEVYSATRAQCVRGIAICEQRCLRQAIFSSQDTATPSLQPDFMAKGKVRAADGAPTRSGSREAAVRQISAHSHPIRPARSNACLDTPEPSNLERMFDYDLLCLLLGRCLAAPIVGRVAANLLERFDGLGGIAAADASELGRVNGVAAAAILDLKLLRQLSVRLARSTVCARLVLSSWHALLAYARIALAHLPREQFRTLYLDRRNILLRDEWVADGSVDHAPVYPREVIRRALELSASALILIHNHPSGDPAPSQADITVTRQIVDAAKLFNLVVHDHLIVGREGTASFKSLGLI